VAYRIARRARAARFRRLAKEQTVPAPTAPAADTPDHSADLLAVLDEELAKLPEQYRAAVMVCDIEGRTRKDAAARLGVPAGRPSTRLRARGGMLARGLPRRGVTLGAGGVAAALSQAPATARVSAALADATARFAAGTPPSGPDLPPSPRGNSR